MVPSFALESVVMCTLLCLKIKKKNTSRVTFVRKSKMLQNQKNKRKSYISINHVRASVWTCVCYTRAIVFKHFFCVISDIKNKFYRNFTKFHIKITCFSRLKCEIPLKNWKYKHWRSHLFHTHKKYHQCTHQILSNSYQIFGKISTYLWKILASRLSRSIFALWVGVFSVL